MMTTEHALDDPHDPRDQRIPFGRVVKFVRQLTHHVRNELSAIDLEAAYITELERDPTVKEEILTLRKTVTSTAQLLRAVSQCFQPVSLHKTPWPGDALGEELRERIARAFPEDTERVQMEFRLQKQDVVELDIELVAESVLSLLRNAFQFGEKSAPGEKSARGEKDALSEKSAQITVTLFAEGTNAVLEVREPKTNFESTLPVEEWGQSPLISTSPSGYGLSLFYIRKIQQSHNGTFETTHTGNTLQTRLSFPLS